MADIVSDVMDDGTIRVFDLDVCQAHAEAILDDLWEKEGKVVNLDYFSTVFALFAETVHHLTAAGWSTEELICAVIEHSDADDVGDFIDTGDSPSEDSEED